MVVVKWSEKVEGSGGNIDSPLCGGLYKEEDDSLVPWSGTDPDAKMNSEYPVNKTVEKFYCKSHHKGKDNKYGVGSSTKSGVTCH